MKNEADIFDDMSDKDKIVAMIESGLAVDEQDAREQLIDMGEIEEGDEEDY